MNNEEKILELLSEMRQEQSRMREEMSEMQIKSLSVINTLQDDVAVLKNAVRYLTSELETIKKAI